MGKTSCVRHSPNARYVKLREDYIAICDGLDCAAKILDLFEYWTNCKLEAIKEVRSYNTMAKKLKQPEMNEPTLWLYERVADFREGLLNDPKFRKAVGRPGTGSADTHIKASLKFLHKKGFISWRASRQKCDNTKEYLLNTSVVQKAIDAWWEHQQSAESLEKSDESDLTDHESDLTDHESDLTDHESDLTDIFTNSQSISLPKNSYYSSNEAPPKPGAPPTQESVCVADPEVSQEDKGNSNNLKDSQTTTLATKQDLISIREESIVSGKDKNSAATNENDYQKSLSDAEIAKAKAKLESRYTEGRLAKQWLEDKTFHKFIAEHHLVNTSHWQKASRPPQGNDAKSWVRTKLKEDAGIIQDKWEAYQQELARRVEVEQIKQPAAEPAVAEQAPPRKNNQFQFYRSAIKSNVPILRPHRERGIEWAKQQPNVALVFDDNGEVIDIEEF